MTDRPERRWHRRYDDGTVGRAQTLHDAIRDARTATALARWDGAFNQRQVPVGVGRWDDDTWVPATEDEIRGVESDALALDRGGDGR